MKRVRLWVSYDGTHYCGWQIQNNGITIEEVLNRTLTELCREEIAVIGASRTDSGVHALGNVAVFDTSSRIPGEKFCFALNQRLPEDIRIQRSDEVPKDWHPRYQNTVKTYEYCFLNRKIPDPTRRLYTYFVYYPMDVEKMQQAANYLVGEHDFKSFCTPRTQVLTTVREIYELSLTREGDVIRMRIRGNGFLYNMVRIIAGTLARVGTGLYEPEQVKDMLEAKDRQKAGPKAPPQGLTLVEIAYPDTE
ncbi:MAG: tRNA pseudouridine(38-40) synthase TruA [Lachnospiraceae bacterium]|nr:tRNA pseudouridine(38-40) synthase TruA [Lachnospiraceae bacterium]